MVYVKNEEAIGEATALRWTDADFAGRTELDGLDIYLAYAMMDI